MEYIRSLRQAKGLSLRDVEEKSIEAGYPISNPYLSQLENDRIKSPSPRVLRTLAIIYDISYSELMNQFGYLALDQNVRTLHVGDFSECEFSLLKDFVNMIRLRREQNNG